MIWDHDKSLISENRLRKMVDEKESQIIHLESNSKKLEETRSVLDAEAKSQQTIIESQKIKMGHVELELEKLVGILLTKV
jgi:hypothetical protein